MHRRLRRSALSALGLAMLSLLAWSGPATAGGIRHHEKWASSPAEGYAVPLQYVYQFPAALVWQPPTPPGYAVPLQYVYQFPAALVDQPAPINPAAFPATISMPIPVPNGAWGY